MKRDPQVVRARVLQAIAKAGKPLTRGELVGMYLRLPGPVIQAALEELLADEQIERTTVPDRRGPWALGCAAFQLREGTAPGNLF